MIRSFVKNGRLMTLTIALLIVSGFAALSTLPRTEDPRIANRMASIITQLPGASAERIEVLISEKIEQKLRKLAQIKLITSVSRPGISFIQIKLNDDVVDSAPIWSRVRDLVADVTPQFPINTIAPLIEDDRGYAFTELIALNWQGNEPVDIASLGRFANELQNQLRLVAGTDLVSIFGQGEEEILVEIDQSISHQIPFTAADISQKILMADAKVPAGNLVNDTNQMQLELTGALDSVQRIKQIPLREHDNGAMLYVEDIAKVEKTLAWPPRNIVLVNDQPSVVVATRMLPHLRIDQWTTTVHRVVEDFSTQLPKNIVLETLFDQNSYTSKRLGSLVVNISMGFIIISVVLLVTLGWRSALIVALSLPLTVLFTLSVMNFYGLPIHQMSVTGLVVALGIMVDNAIVMTDTIQTNRQNGMRRLDSVGHAIGHLWQPLLGSTITTVLAFMPIVLMPGPAGEFVGGIALSVIFSLLGSYVISHTIVAGLAGRFIGKGTEQAPRWYHVGIHLPTLNTWFTRLLLLALTYRKTVILLVFCLPLTGFLVAKHLAEQFFPTSDRDMFHIELFLPAQSSILNTEKVSRKISQYLYRQSDIESVHWFIGKSAPSFYYNLIPSKDGAQYYAQAMVTTTDFESANHLIPELQIALDDLLPEAQILVRKLEQGPPFNAPVELRVYGQNLDTLKTIGDDLRRLMSETKDIMHTRATLQPGTPKIWLQTNEDAALLSGLTLVDISSQLSASLNGAINGSIIEANETIPIRVRVDNAHRSELTSLANMTLVSKHSPEPIPLSAIADLTIKPSRGAIPHRNGARVNVIEGYIRSGILPSVVLNNIKATMLAQGYHLPSGYTLEIGGESAERNDAVGKLLASVGVIFTLLIAVVVLSFNSFRLSGIIFLSAIQSVGLGLLSIYIFDYPFGFTVIIGLLGLMGLAINAAIVIIAELKSNKEAVNGQTNAIVDSVLTCTRHISSTTITTVGGFLPLILAGGGFWPPFAVAVAGGTVLTTLLSLFFVPAAFSLLSQHKPFSISHITSK